MPRAVSSRLNASSPDTRKESSLEMTRAATFLPLKLRPYASMDFHVDVNLGAASTTAVNEAVSRRTAGNGLGMAARSIWEGGARVRAGRTPRRSAVQLTVPMADWKDTLNLPRTEFPMKANLQTAEPEMMARWREMGLYGLIRARRAGAPRYILHDGPPYANGQIHLGTAMNKILKDLVVKTRSMAGFDAPYVPGYDCHGLPIELKVDRELGPKKRDLSAADFRRACRGYAERYIDVMTEEFQRLGIFGEWDRPYLTMDFRYQAAIARSLGKCVGRGLVYKGKKPVHWCIHCRTALAEAEVEYEDHLSPSIYVTFPIADASRAELASRVPALAGRDVQVLIWTTTPWTIPSNLAVAFHPEYTYGAYKVDGAVVLVAESWPRASASPRNARSVSRWRSCRVSGWRA